MITVGERISAARKSKGLKQDQLGALVNLSSTGISSIENGKSIAPDSVKAIASQFPEWYDWIMTGDGPTPPGILKTSAKKTVDENPWKDALVMEMQNEIAFYKEIIRNLTGGSVKGNFLKAVRMANDSHESALTVQAA